MASILALDPGRTTGFALAIIEDDKPYVGYAQKELNHRQFYDFVELCAQSTGDSLNIVCEKFNYRHNKTGVDLYPVELIGVLKYYTAAHYTNYIYWQEPSVQGKDAYFSDKKLKALDLYLKGDDYHHGRSAVKHLLQWLQFGHGSSFEADLDQAELVTTEWAIAQLI